MNLEAIRAKLAGLNNKSGGKKNDLWRPKDVHTIRCLPYSHGDEPFVELAFHYDIGDTRSVLCPKEVFGDDCVICDYADLLKNWNDESGSEKPESIRKADWEIFRKLQAKPRWYIPMVERGKESEGAKFWAFGKVIYEELLRMCLDAEMNDDVENEGGTLVLTDLKSAYDITIDFHQKNNGDGKGNDKNWPKTIVKEKKRPSKLSATKKDEKAIIDSVKNIRDIFPKVSSESIATMFNEWLSSNQEEVKEVKDSGIEYESKSDEAPVVGGQSIDEAFGELVDD